MWTYLLDRVLVQAVQHGRLSVTFSDGKTRVYGPGGGPEARVSIHDSQLARRILMTPHLALGEGYMAGGLTFPSDKDLRAFMVIAVRSMQEGLLPLPMRLAGRARILGKRAMQGNTPTLSAKRAAHHYDIPDEFYALFLDENQQYTCAYYTDETATLQEAQLAKMAHIAAKLCLRSGLRVLDIGCGWGGLALHLAQQHGVHVTGITLSEVQLVAARAQAEALGLADKVEFRLQDYRNVPDRFDRVVSVGMLEHVGAPLYGIYFTSIREMLVKDGLALIHFIGRSGPPAVLSAWFHKYIFPGGYAPAFSEIIAPFERSGLVMTDLEVLRGHYERTLRDWQVRFRANEPKVQAMFDETFVRMWWWYLVAAEVSFTDMGLVVFQMQIARDPGAAPATRDYLYL